MLLPLTVAALLLALPPAAAVTAAAAAAGSVTAAAALGPTLNALGQPLLTPSKFTMLSRAVYYEVPERPVGTLVFLHGCAHDASDGWPRSDACAECDGAWLARAVGGCGCAAAAPGSMPCAMLP